MKFVYEYRTSDNVRHRDVIRAADREAAFSLLRARGIRPGSLEDAPGVFNKLFGKGKRWIAIVVLAAASLTFAWLAWTAADEPEPDRYSRNGVAIPCARRQVWGDETLVESAAKNGWGVVFGNPADRLLATFAQPGVRAGLSAYTRSTTNDFAVAMKTPITIAADDLEEYKQIKCIVAGMRDELSDYLKEGGTVSSYVQRLVERQNEECLIFDRERKNFLIAIKGESANAMTLWRDANARLRAMGLPTIPLPE